MSHVRKSFGKRLRFEILKRDGFACRHCGANASDALLQVDHVVPVVEGGTNDPENLITSCQPCNSGKSGISLDASTLPSATTTEAMIEHADQMREYLAAVKDQENARRECVDYVIETWESAVGYMNADQRASMPSIVRDIGIEKAIEAVYATTRAQTNDSYQRALYFYGVVRNMKNRGSSR